MPENNSSERARRTRQASVHSLPETASFSLARVIMDRREDTAGQIKSIKARKKLINNNLNYNARDTSKITSLHTIL